MNEQRQRTEAMRQEALAYQVEHQGRDDSEWALRGEIECMIELLLPAPAFPRFPSPPRSVNWSVRFYFHRACRFLLTTIYQYDSVVLHDRTDPIGNRQGAPP